MMEDTQSDFTMTFRQLSEISQLQLHNRNFTQVELKQQTDTNREGLIMISAFVTA